MITKNLTDLPADFPLLEDESKQDGFRFLEKMRNEWLAGKNRFQKPGEMLYGVFDGEKLVAIGGINVDPYASAPGVGRVRHLYVLKAYRRSGLGQSLVERMLKDGTRYFTSFHLRTDTSAAAAFYESIGFKRVDLESATHEWIT